MTVIPMAIRSLFIKQARKISSFLKKSTSHAVPPALSSLPTEYCLQIVSNGLIAVLYSFHYTFKSLSIHITRTPFLLLCRFLFLLTYHSFFQKHICGDHLLLQSISRHTIYQSSGSYLKANTRELCTSFFFVSKSIELFS